MNGILKRKPESVQHV